MKRRDFVRFLGAGTVCGAAGFSSRDLGIKASSVIDSDKSDFYFTEPFDGGIIHADSGDPVLGSDGSRLKIRVSGIAPKDALISITGPSGQTIPAKRSGNRFTAEVFLEKRFSEIQADLKQGTRTESIRTRPVWAQNSYKRFKFQIDDNSFFLRELAEKKYKSLFSHFYLAGLRHLNRKYGAKFELNCFFSTPERDFDLTKMPEIYKSEFEDNANWLRLAFHADNEFPDNPYQSTDAARFTADFDKTAEQLQRFAGKAYTPPAIIHWGNIRRETYQPLYNRGVRTLSGYFTPTGTGSWIVSFQLPEKVCRYLNEHEGFYDFDSRLAFSRLHIVCNSIPLAKIVPTLEQSQNNPNTSQLIDFLTHEQYFFPFYKNYIPEHFARLDAAIGFAVEKGHKPVWHHNGFFSCD